MNILRQTLSKLSKSDRDQLLYALEQDLTHWVRLPDSKFIGVNIEHLSNLTILESSGSWAYGDIND